MKWYNKDKTECLDLSKISYWKYWCKGQYQGEKKEALKVVVDGHELYFRSQEAEEIYNIIKNNKELL